MTDYTKLLGDFPEINPANYGDDEVNALNAWGIAAHTAIEALQAECAEHKENAIRNARIAASIRAERDQLQSKLDAMGKGEPVAHVYAIERTGRPLVAWDDEKGIGLGDKLYAAPKVLAPEPDMFWINDDPERQHDSIEEFLNDEMCQGQPVEVGAVYTIQQAKRLPNVQIEVTSIDEESCEAEYEVLSAHEIGGTP